MVDRYTWEIRISLYQFLLFFFSRQTVMSQPEHPDVYSSRPGFIKAANLLAPTTSHCEQTTDGDVLVALRIRGFGRTYSLSTRILRFLRIVCWKQSATNVPWPRFVLLLTVPKFQTKSDSLSPSQLKILRSRVVSVA